jgi:hypothetical protein
MAAATLSVGVLLAILEAAPEIRVPFRVDSITVASSEGNLKEAAVIETSRIAKVRSVSASLWIAPAPITGLPTRPKSAPRWNDGQSASNASSAGNRLRR